MGYTLNAGSALESLSLTLIEMQECHEKKLKYDELVDMRDNWRSALGLMDLIRKILSLRNHQEFDKFWSHIPLFLESDSVAQNKKGKVMDSAGNKLFELLVALSVMPLGKNLELEDPDYSSTINSNPDVMINISKKTWGFACKVPHTKNLKTYGDNLEIAINQIERSGSDRGIVLFNLKNIIDHDSIWPIEKDPETEEIIYSGYSDLEAAKLQLTKVVDDSAVKVIEELGGADEVAKLFESKKAIPLALNYLNTMFIFEKGGMPHFTMLRIIRPMFFSNEVSDEEALKVMGGLDMCLQDQDGSSLFNSM